MKNRTPDDLKVIDRLRTAQAEHEANRVKAQALIDSHGIDAKVITWYESLIEGYDDLSEPRWAVHDLMDELREAKRGVDNGT